MGNPQVLPFLTLRHLQKKFSYRLKGLVNSYKNMVPWKCLVGDVSSFIMVG